MSEIDDILVGITRAVDKYHRESSSRGWWRNPILDKMVSLGYMNRQETEQVMLYVYATKLMLIVSEIAEGMEGLRKGKMDEHLPHRSSIEVELADACIRIFDLAGALKLDLAGAIAEKGAYNIRRTDHTTEHRAAEGGKKF